MVTEVSPECIKQRDSHRGALRARTTFLDLAFVKASCALITRRGGYKAAAHRGMLAHPLSGRQSDPVAARRIVWAIPYPVIWRSPGVEYNIEIRAVGTPGRYFLPREIGKRFC